jgi:CysZ protein
MLTLSVLPIAVTAALYVFVIGFFVDAIRGAVLGSALGLGLDPGGTPITLLGWITDLLLLVAGAVTFSLMAAAVASPFNDALALRAERHGDPPLPPVPGRGLERQLELVVLDVVRNALAALAAAAALFLWWLPFVNLFWIVLAFALVAFQYVSYPQNRRGIGLLAGLAFLGRHRWSAVGLGASLTVLFAIPILSSAVLPLAVVSGTLLVARAQPRPDRPALR